MFRERGKKMSKKIAMEDVNVESLTDEQTDALETQLKEGRMNLF